ncbi:hypothetical protein FRC01_002356 [Tulasnella sp. 417]|nr:hypothetical protein FRC01_002356 [Tulasnella sp. 417]
MIDVYYTHHLQQGNHRLCFDVALQAAEQYQHLSDTHEISPRLAGALDKAASCAEILGEHETARPLLHEAIGVYREVVGVDPKGKQVHIHDLKILLARALVRYFRVVHRLGHDIAGHLQKDAPKSLREAIEIYTVERSFGQSGAPKYGEELKDALLDLLEVGKRKKAQKEVAEVEAAKPVAWQGAGLVENELPEHIDFRGGSYCGVANPCQPNDDAHTTLGQQFKYTAEPLGLRGG